MWDNDDDADDMDDDHGDDDGLDDGGGGFCTQTCRKILVSLAQCEGQMCQKGRPLSFDTRR